ncbi:MAG: hypothetical protein GY929_21530 [Actinomycetia bacterium]|nr:hypothetical protein [Actinomycetes bacterium]
MFDHARRCPADPPERWDTEHGFRGSAAGRDLGREVEFGSRWMSGVDALPWRASWLESTGEFVIVECRPGGGSVELLGWFSSRPGVEEALAGWWQMCGHLGSLPWLRSRVASGCGSRPGP